MIFRIWILTLLFTIPAGASEQAQVIKVQGNRALVLFPPGETPRMGQVLAIGSAGDAKLSRQYTTALTGELSALNYSSTGLTTTSFLVGGQYGWNYVDYEFGPKLQLGYSSNAATTFTILAGGAYGDYNLVPNLLGQTIVYGGTGSLMVGQTTVQSGAGSTSAYIDFAAGGVLKWYQLATSSTGLRLELVYNYNRGFSGADVSRSGLIARAGLQTYF